MNRNITIVHVWGDGSVGSEVAMTVVLGERQTVTGVWVARQAVALAFGVRQG